MVSQFLLVLLLLLVLRLPFLVIVSFAVCLPSQSSIRPASHPSMDQLISDAARMLIEVTSPSFLSQCAVHQAGSHSVKLGQPVSSSSRSQYGDEVEDESGHILLHSKWKWRRRAESRRLRNGGGVDIYHVHKARGDG